MNAEQAKRFLELRDMLENWNAAFTDGPIIRGNMEVKYFLEKMTAIVLHFCEHLDIIKARVSKNYSHIHNTLGNEFFWLCDELLKHYPEDTTFDQADHILRSIIEADELSQAAGPANTTNKQKSAL